MQKSAYFLEFFTKRLPENAKTFKLREAILQKIPEFYEFFFTNGGGEGQPDFISLIQKYVFTQKYG